MLATNNGKMHLSGKQIKIGKTSHVPLPQGKGKGKGKGKETLFIHGIQFKAGSLWGRVEEMNVVFWLEGKTGVPGEKPLGGGKRTEVR